MKALSRRARLFLLAPLAFVAVLFGATFFGDEPLRRAIEKGMNAKLTGYTAAVGRAHLSLFGLSVTLRDVSVSQQANPDPPVLQIPRLHASVHWKALLRLRLVADFLLERPRLHVNRQQLLHEDSDGVEIEDRGWQKALESIYPLKINLLRVADGAVTYIDAAGSPPLAIEQLQGQATNIRNVSSEPGVYPSPVEATGVILGTGRGSVRGHANFLAEPHPGARVLFELARVPLDPFRTLVARSNLLVKGGVVSTAGELEFAPGVQFVRVGDLAVEKVTIDYLHTSATAGEERQRAAEVKEAVREAAASPGTDLRLERLTITRSELGFVNRAKKPAYRLFLSDASITATGFSNGLRAGPADVRVAGRFMGTGPTEVKATFRPGRSGADFEVAVAIRDTAMRPMNDLLRAYGRFDVVAGSFSFFSQLEVKNGAVDGYVKPLFRDVKVYDSRQDARKKPLRKFYEKVVGGVARLLENRKRDEVATKTRVRGDIGDPRTSTVEVVFRLVENAFIRSILPGLDDELSRQKRRPPPERRREPARGAA